MLKTINFVILVLISGFALAQSVETYPYLLESQAEGQIVRRGISDTRGIPSTELILRPNTVYRLWVLESTNLRVGIVSFQTPANGLSFTIPPITFRNPITPDTDADDLHDEAEFILGTSPINPDTDNDGINDGAEIQQGLNPLDGLAVINGVVASVGTPGSAIHVHAFNDMAVVAEEQRGISIFNVFNAMAPVIIGQVETPGAALAAHFSGRFIAVADGPSGLAVIDVVDPPAALIVRQITANTLGGQAQAVVTTANIAYVGLTTSKIAVADLESGAILQTLSVQESSVQDLAIAGDRLFALTQSALYSFDLTDDYRQLARLTVSGSTAPLEIGRKLFVGSEYAYVGYFQGFSIIDIRTAGEPEIVGTPTGTQAAIHDLVTNGSGLLAATTSFAGASTLAVSTYDVTDPADVTRLITSYDTPGLSRALSIYNGLAYVADSNEGLQVVNYQAYDASGMPPTVDLGASFPLAPGIAEEGKLVRVSARVSDDVQVRNVEFYLDGVKAATDGSYPFEFRFVTPLMIGRTGFTLRARASDTGGNATWTDTFEITLVEDATPPKVYRTLPNNGAVLGRLNAVGAVFNEPINVESLDQASFSLREAGIDGQFGTGDDQTVIGGFEWREDILAAFLRIENDLTPGFYQGGLTTNVTDLKGNPLLEPVNWIFRIFDVNLDRDEDGVPDELEAVLGLDPDNPDSDGDGLRDGEEDFDQDGLTNFQEVVLGSDLTNPDEDNDGILDGLQDSDADGLTDVAEVFVHNTNPNHPDSDGDKFSDGDEVQDGSNPLDPQSLPPTLFQGLVMQFSIQNQASIDAPALSLHNIAYPFSLSVQNQAGPGVREKKVISPIVGVSNQ